MTADELLRFKRVVIFERAQSAAGGFGVRERLAACFRLARSRGWIVEELCQAGDENTADEFERALEICEYTGASLLTYQAGIAQDSERLGSVELLQACMAIGACA